MSVLSLPKVEIESFDGDPLKYHKFIALFEESVEKLVKDDKVRLTRLLQYTTGSAKQAIQGCISTDGDSGYKQARDILCQRFGNKHLVVNRILNNLRLGKAARTADDMQQLTDELSNSRLTLRQLGRLQDVDNHIVILDIIGRFPLYVKNRWKRHALKYKQEEDKYPDFEELVKFLSIQAQEAADPVYGDHTYTNKSKSISSNNNVKTATSFVSVADQRVTGVYPCVVCKDNHRLFYCDSFKAMRPQERLNIVIEHKLCHNV